ARAARHPRPAAVPPIAAFRQARYGLPREARPLVRHRDPDARAPAGLGLAIVKHIVSRHRGQLSIESEEGTGASFRVWLPAPPLQG
ncbi:MAG: ATP-binding protein, partial [Acetobacteraceae bacterium]|nr:ATP-binding protein [Acetobacteraceae bacterium]